MKPARELLGEALIELGRHAEARVQLEKALLRGPRRALPLVALERAIAGAEGRQAGAPTRRVLRQIWHQADPEVAARIPETQGSD